MAEVNEEDFRPNRNLRFAAIFALFLYMSPKITLAYTVCYAIYYCFRLIKR